MDVQLTDLLRDFALSSGHLTVLTGAGLSADSGIPTFRGKEGYWRAGSQNYRPEEMATLRMFEKQPLEVWKWYLYRAGVCAAAKPNPGHYALRDMELLLGNRFQLVSQNVDGLHSRAGSSEERTWLIHGSINKSRCVLPCSDAIYPAPDISFTPDMDFTSEDLSQLYCPACKRWLRPHILWFDESYNEEYYHLESVINEMELTDLLLVVGTSLATGLPHYMVERVFKRNVPVIFINPEKTDVSGFSKGNSFQIAESSSIALPKIYSMLENSLVN